MSLKVAIRGGALIDGTGKEPLEDATILIEENQIKKIGRGLQIPSGAEVVEASGKTVMPGLMDMHIHLGLFLPLPPGEQSVSLAMLKTPPTLRILYGAKFAKDSLEAGFTTLRTADYAYFVSLREAIKRELVPGPRLVVAGNVGMTGGHFDLIWPSTWPREHLGALDHGPVDGVWEVRKRVRRLLCREGADLIKTCASGGQMGEGEQGWWRNYTVEELEAMVDEAHAVGKRVAAHCVGTVGIRNAVEAGIDSIDHCARIDEMAPREFEETVEAITRKNLIVVPTLTVGWANVQYRVEDGVMDYLIEKSKTDLPHTIDSFKRLHQAGVKLASGSDIAGYMPLLRHGDNAVELELRVEHGMSPMDAIVSATRNSAECAGILDRTGTLEEGKLADLIVVDGDPLKDIAVLKRRENIHLVMKEGRTFVRRE